MNFGDLSAEGCQLCGCAKHEKITKKHAFCNLAKLVSMLCSLRKTSKKHRFCENLKGETYLASIEITKKHKFSGASVASC